MSASVRQHSPLLWETEILGWNRNWLLKLQRKNLKCKSLGMSLQISLTQSWKFGCVDSEKLQTSIMGKKRLNEWAMAPRVPTMDILRRYITLFLKNPTDFAKKKNIYLWVTQFLEVTQGHWHYTFPKAKIFQKNLGDCSIYYRKKLQ